MTSEAQVPSAAQRGAMEAASASRNALVEAQHHVLKALGRPHPGRERRWAMHVSEELRAAEQALSKYRNEVEADEGLYAEIQRDAPWLLPRIRQMKNQLHRIAQEGDHLQEELVRVVEGDLHPLGSIRYEAERMLLGLRDLLAREGDLLLERFNEPAAQD